MSLLMIRNAARFALAGALLVCGWLPAARSDEKTYTLRLQHYFPPTSPEQTDWLVSWARLLEQDSKGRLKVEIYPAMKLGGRPTELFEQARTGVVDVAWTITGYTPDRFPRLQVFELPWVAPREGIRASAAAWDYYESYAKDEFADVKLLAIATSGGATLFLHNHEVRRPSDLAKLAIRVPTPIVAGTFRAYGALPSSVAVTELGPAFAKGDITGLATPARLMRTLNLSQYIDHVTEFTSDETLYTALYIIVMNKARFDSLPLDLRGIIESRSGHQLSARLGWQMDLWEREAEQVFRGGGAQVFSVGSDAMAPWKTAAEGQIAAWVARRNAAGDDGRMLLEAFREIVDEYR